MAIMIMVCVLQFSISIIMCFLMFRWLKQVQSLSQDMRNYVDDSILKMGDKIYRGIMERIKLKLKRMQIIEEKEIV